MPVQGIDYAELATVAEELIGANGRSVTLRDQTAAPADSDAPWRGPGDSDPDDVSAIAVVIPTELVDTDDQLVGRGEQTAYVAASEELGDLTRFDQLIESDGTTWRIEEAQTLRPGDLRLLYIFGLSR